MIQYYDMKKALLIFITLLAGFAFAEEQIINGQKWVCKDGLCMPVEEDAAETNAAAAAEAPALPEELVDGQKWVCKDGLCMLVEDSSEDGRQPAAGADENAQTARKTRLAQGYMDVDEFIAFLENEKKAPFFDGKAWW